MTELAHRDEYLEAALRCAARVMWLALIRDWYAKTDFEPSPEVLESETTLLRRCLVRGPREDSDADRLRVHVLKLLGIQQSYGASSAQVERAE